MYAANGRPPHRSRVQDQLGGLEKWLQASAEWADKAIVSQKESAPKVRKKNCMIKRGWYLKKKNRETAPGGGGGGGGGGRLEKDSAYILNEELIKPKASPEGET